MTQQSPSEANRARFPEFSKVVDEYRAVFGPDVKVLWCREGTEIAGIQPEEVSVNERTASIHAGDSAPVSDAEFTELESGPADDW